MIYSQTFIPVPGSTTISDPSFSGAKIYGVKRNGLGYTEVSVIPTNREFLVVYPFIIFDASNPFVSGDTVLVLYDKQSGVVPPDCIIPSIGPGGTTDSLPDAISGVAYIHSIPLDGTAPFTLANVVNPAWMTIAISGSDIVFSGTPAGGDIGTDIVVSFDVENCHASDLVYTDLIDVLIPAGQGAFTLTNEIAEAGNSINAVFPVTPFYTIYSGGFPVGPSSVTDGYMTSGVADAVGVYISRTGFSILGLELYKNAVLQETIFFTVSGTYYFTLLTFTVADAMEIKLIYGF